MVNPAGDSSPAFFKKLNRKHNEYLKRNNKKPIHSYC
jgi:hypothetical protein